MNLLFWKKKPVEVEVHVAMKLVLKDGSTFNVSRKYYEGTPVTGWHYYREFYKWYFCREASDKYIFPFKDSEVTLLRSNIQTISLKLVDEKDILI